MAQRFKLLTPIILPSTADYAGKIKEDRGQQKIKKKLFYKNIKYSVRYS